MTDTGAREPRPQRDACDECSQGVLDDGNPHTWGECDCACHALAAGVGVPPDEDSGCAPAKERQDARCICDPPGWLEARDEDCPVHGREALPAFWSDETEAYPREDGDFLVLGPELFTLVDDHSVISWRGENYVSQGEARPAEPTHLEWQKDALGEAEVLRQRAGRLREQLDAARKGLEDVIAATRDFTAPNWWAAVQRIEAIARAALGVVGPPPDQATAEVSALGQKASETRGGES